MKYKIGDIVDVNNSSIRKDDDIDEIRYLDTSNLTEGSFYDVQIFNFKKDKVPSRARRKVKINDILISTVRPNQKHYGFIEKEQEDYIVSTGFAVLSPKPNKVDPYFLYKYLTLDNITAKLQVIAEDSTSAYPSIKPSVIKDIEINLPDLKIQKKISSFLKNIDEKIELNDSIISNLEEFSQTLFKRWFVDFEFPNENKEPYKSSGGKMVESELGMIPEGWKVELLGDISEIQNGFAFKSKDYVNNGVKVLRTLNIHPDGLLVNNVDLKYLPSEFYDNGRYDKQKLQKFDSLLVMVGATIGKLGMVMSPNVPSLQNQNMWRFRTKKENLSNVLIYLYLKDVIKESINWRSGSAREFFRKDSFAKYPIILPPEMMLIKKQNILKLIFNKIDNLNSQVENLTKLRDTLLPKLLSGELKLPETMEVIEDVSVS